MCASITRFPTFPKYSQFSHRLTSDTTVRRRAAATRHATVERRIRATPEPSANSYVREIASQDGSLSKLRAWSRRVDELPDTRARG